jgi:DNA polymerase III delta subunit
MIPTDLQAGLGQSLGGVFYLHGEDEYGKEAAARSLVDAHLDPATADFNYDLLRGSEADMEAIASAIGTPPMMADWRVVLFRETEAVASSAKARGMLLEAAQSPPPGLALILQCTVPERSTARFYKDLEKSARSLEFQTPNANDLPAWLIGWSRSTFRRELSEPAARALAQAMGRDVGALAGELEKLSTLTEEGEEITLDTVTSAGTRVLRQDRWEWFDLVGRRRFLEALEGVEILLTHGETGVGLVIGLGTHLLRIGVVLAGGPEALEAILPPRQRWLAKRYRDQARSWTMASLENALAGLATADRLLKASPMSDAHFLETWILAQAAVSEAAA